MAYEVIISAGVLKTLDAIIFYLESNWSKKVAVDFLLTFYEKVDTIALTPQSEESPLKILR